MECDAVLTRCATFIFAAPPIRSQVKTLTAVPTDRTKDAGHQYDTSKEPTCTRWQVRQRGVMIVRNQQRKVRVISPSRRMQEPLVEKS